MELYKPSQKGLHIERYYTKENISPFEMCTYEKRSSIIRNPDGSVVFHMDDIEVPSSWSQVATDILAQKYIRKAGVPLRTEKGELLLDQKGKIVTGSETSLRQVVHRMAGCWRHWGEKYGYFASSSDAQNFYDEIVFMLINQYAAPNSPQWFTTGLNWAYGLTGNAQGHSYVDPLSKKLEYSQDAYSRSQAHACFIQRIEDDLVRPGGIINLLTREARIFKYGSGTGTNFSTLRGKGESLSGGGTSSGVMSFLKIFDAAAGSIKSGGTTRRAAKMVCLDIDHPEIEEFIWWKVREEEKVASLVAGSKIMKQKLSKLIELAKNKPNPLEDQEVQKVLKEAAASKIPINYLVRVMDLAQQGYSLPLREFDTHYESEAYITVSGQNSNNSVRISNEFFQALEKNSLWALKGRIGGKTFKEIPAQKLWDSIGYCAWASADPGLQYDTTINEWHTCPSGGRINASNPCSEYMFLDDTACNLASLNLVKFYYADSGRFDANGYMHAVRLWTIVLEISVLMAHFPSEEVAKNSYLYRTLGLGYANLGSLLMLQSIPYDSEEGRALAAAITSITTGCCYAASAEMASILGPFERYEENKNQMLRVIKNHRCAAYDLDQYRGLTVKPKALNQKICLPELLNAAHETWDKALSWGENFGFRNAQTTVLAPTGTIGLVMDCDTTGVEPDYALVKFKKLAGGGYFKIVNQSVPKALQKLGYSREQIKEIIEYCLGRGTFAGSPFVNKISLLQKGLPAEKIEAIEKQLRDSMDICFLFNKWSLGEDIYNRVMPGGEGNFLEKLGFSREEINAANEYICGSKTLEGAPHLKLEHYPVFDCANRCGDKGKRFIHPYGHLKMLAAVQPFISGAISKTINMPREWTVEQIKKAYYDAWTMMIKAVALYRDGCKLSQPLNSTLENYPELKSLLETAEENSAVKEIIRKKVKVGPKYLLLSAEMKESQVGRVSYKYDELSPAQQAMMDALLSSVNLNLQNGLKPALIAASLNASGHPLINELAAFLQEFEDGAAQTSLNKFYSSQNSNGKEKCPSCGATQLRQNGTCQVCEVCGTTTGCS